jgi:hypothetical protein
MTSGRGDDPPSWRIRNPRPLIGWAFQADVPTDDGVLVLEFLRDVICRDPDFGEVIDTHTRRAMAAGTDIALIWTFDPDLHCVEVLVPRH